MDTSSPSPSAGSAGKSHPGIPGPPRGLAALLVAFSLVFALVLQAFLAALQATPYETVDSAGREMGFNDVFTPEHYGIIVRSMSVGRTLDCLLYTSPSPRDS